MYYGFWCAMLVLFAVVPKQVNIYRTRVANVEINNVKQALERLLMDEDVYLSLPEGNVSKLKDMLLSCGRAIDVLQVRHYLGPYLIPHVIPYLMIASSTCCSAWPRSTRTRRRCRRPRTPGTRCRRGASACRRCQWCRRWRTGATPALSSTSPVTYPYTLPHRRHRPPGAALPEAARVTYRRWLKSNRRARPTPRHRPRPRPRPRPPASARLFQCLHCRCTPLPLAGRNPMLATQRAGALARPRARVPETRRLRTWRRRSRSAAVGNRGRRGPYTRQRQLPGTGAQQTPWVGCCRTCDGCAGLGLLPCMEGADWPAWALPAYGRCHIVQLLLTLYAS